MCRGPAAARQPCVHVPRDSFHAATVVEQLLFDCLMAAHRRLCCMACPAQALAFGTHHSVQLTSKTLWSRSAAGCF